MPTARRSDGKRTGKARPAKKSKRPSKTAKKQPIRQFSEDELIEAGVLPRKLGAPLIQPIERVPRIVRRLISIIQDIQDFQEDEERIRQQRTRGLATDEGDLLIRRIMGDEPSPNMQQFERKKTRKKTKTDKKMSKALRQANEKLRTKKGKLRKGKTQADIMKLAHRLLKKM